MRSPGADERRPARATAPLLVHSPTPVDDALAAEIAALGPVGYIVAPNCFHHLHVRTFLARFPGAKVYGAPGLARKRPDLPLAGTLDDGAAMPWSGVIDQITLAGAPKLNEVVFLHRASRSLLVTRSPLQRDRAGHLDDRAGPAAHGDLQAPGPEPPPAVAG